MKFQSIVVPLALASLFVPSMSTAAPAPRPDRAFFDFIEVNDVNGGFAVVNEQALQAGMAPIGIIGCSQSVDGIQVTVSVWLEQQDIVGNKKTNMFGKQSAYGIASVSFFDGVNPPTFISLVSVASCKGSWKLTDVDKDTSFLTGTDSGQAKASCGKDLASGLGLDVPQTALLTAAFGDKFNCRVEGTPTAGCFRGDTTVATESGPKAIRDVRVGEKVWSWNEETGRNELQPVLQTHLRPATGLRALEVDGQVFHVTDTHPYWVEGKGWTSAAKVAAGDVVRTRENKTFRVTSNERTGREAFYAGYDTASDREAAMRHPIFRMIPASTGSATGETGYVYNLEVAGTHTFFVGDRQVLVHNK